MGFHQNFEKNPERYQDPVLWAWLEIFSPVIFFSAPHPKGIAKALAADPVRLNTLTGTKTSFLTTKT